jgi:hypothetical protein
MRMNGPIERRSVGRTAISKGALLFFSAQRGVFTSVAVDVTNVGARIKLGGANVLPPKFQLSFDNFRTVPRVPADLASRRLHRSRVRKLITPNHSIFNPRSRIRAARLPPAWILPQRIDRDPPFQI